MKSSMKRVPVLHILPVLLALAITLTLIPAFVLNANAAGYEWSGGDYMLPDDAGTLTVTADGEGVITVPASVTALTVRSGDGGPFTVTGSFICAGVIELTLENINLQGERGIDGKHGVANIQDLYLSTAGTSGTKGLDALVFQNGGSLIIEGLNTINGGKGGNGGGAGYKSKVAGSGASGSAGILVGSGTLDISGTGSLIVTGGEGGSDGYQSPTGAFGLVGNGGAGIKGNVSMTSGMLEVMGGTARANSSYTRPTSGNAIDGNGIFRGGTISLTGGMILRGGSFSWAPFTNAEKCSGILLYSVLFDLNYPGCTNAEAFEEGEKALPMPVLEPRIGFVLRGWYREAVCETPWDFENDMLENITVLYAKWEESTIELSPLSLPDGTCGAAYSQQLTAGGSTAPYTCALQSGTLPAGLSIENNTLSGTPVQLANDHAFTVRVTDFDGNSKDFDYTITVNRCSPSISGSNALTAFFGAARDQEITASIADACFGGDTPTLPVTIKIYDGTVQKLSYETIADSGSFSHTLPAADINALAAGNYTITASSAGNTNSAGFEETVIGSLSVMVPDKSALNNAVSAARELIDGATFGDRNGDYAPAHQAALEKALADAQAVADREVAAPEDIADVLSALNTAAESFSASLVTVDYTRLNELIALCRPIYDNAAEGEYEAGAKAVFKSAIDAAAAVNQSAEGENRTTQAQADAAGNALRAAMDAFAGKKIINSNKPTETGVPYAAMALVVAGIALCAMLLIIMEKWRRLYYGN